MSHRTRLLRLLQLRRQSPTQARPQLLRFRLRLLLLRFRLRRQLRQRQRLLLRLRHRWRQLLRLPRL